MAGLARRVWKGYKVYHHVVKIIAAIIGVIVGISACVLFISKYHNYHAGCWAAVSSIFALLFLKIVFSVRRDVGRKITPLRFLIYMWVGLFGVLAGFVVMVTYAVLGTQRNESGVDPEGFYLVIVWGFMTFKWSLFSALSARKNYKKYTATDESTMIVNT